MTPEFITEYEEKQRAKRPVAYRPAAAGFRPSSVADPAWTPVCACGSRTNNNFFLEFRSHPLCDGCLFRARVMHAAGRYEEFLADYDEKV